MDEDKRPNVYRIKARVVYMEMDKEGNGQAPEDIKFEEKSFCLLGLSFKDAEEEGKKYLRQFFMYELIDIEFLDKPVKMK